MSLFSQRTIPWLTASDELPEAAPMDEQLRTVHTAIQSFAEIISDYRAPTKTPAVVTSIPTGRSIRTHFATPGVEMDAPTAHQAAARRQPNVLLLPVTDRKRVKASILGLRSVMTLECPDIVVPTAVLCHTAADGTHLAVPPALDSEAFEAVDLHSERGAYVASALAVGLNLVFEPGQVAPVRVLRVVSASDSRRFVGASPAESPTESPRFQALVAPSQSQGTDDGVTRGRGKRGGGNNTRASLQASTLPPPFALWAADGLLPMLYPITWTDPDAAVTMRMRPEFVRNYGKPLCSTALLQRCPVGSKPSHRLAVFEATLHLINDLVPAVARSLEAEARPLTGAALCDRMHVFGVNLRFLGWLLPWLKSPGVIQAVNTEIVARAYKFIENPDEGADWATLTKLAFRKFFPPHVQTPLPRFHDGSLELLQRIHPRYGILVDTLELTDRSERIPGFVLHMTDCWDSRTVPPTPNYGQGYEYDTFLPHMVDGAALEERIGELCHYSDKLMGLPGRWPALCREAVLKEPSATLHAMVAQCQDSLLLRGETCGADSLRVVPLLRFLSTLTARLYPYDVSAVQSEQSASIYLIHAKDVVNAALGGSMGTPASTSAPSPLSASQRSPLSSLAFATGRGLFDTVMQTPDPDSFGRCDSPTTASGMAALQGVPLPPPKEYVHHLMHEVYMSLGWLQHADDDDENAVESCHRAVMASVHPLHQLSTMNLQELIAAANDDDARVKALLNQEYFVANQCLPRTHTIFTALHYRRVADPFAAASVNAGSLGRTDAVAAVATRPDPFLTSGVDSALLTVIRNAASVADVPYISIYCQGQPVGQNSAPPPPGTFAVMDRVDRFIQSVLMPQSLATSASAAQLAMSSASAVGGGATWTPRVLMFVCETSSSTIAREIRRRALAEQCMTNTNQAMVVVPILVDVEASATTNALLVSTDGTEGTITSPLLFSSPGTFRRAPSHLTLGAPGSLQAVSSGGHFAEADFGKLLSVPSGAFSPSGKSDAAGGDGSPDSLALLRRGDSKYASPTALRKIGSKISHASMRRQRQRPPPALRHALTDETVTDAALSALMENRNCLLIISGFGAGGTPVRSLADYGLAGWTGPIVCIVDRRDVRHLPLDAVASAVAKGVPGGDASVSLFLTKLLTVPQIDRALQSRCNASRRGFDGTDALAFQRTTMAALGGALFDVVRSPAMLHHVSRALEDARTSRTSVVTLATLLDSVLYRRYLSCDDANAPNAVSYACALAARLVDEGAHEAKNAQAAEFAHMLPIHINANGVVSFTHVVWRSYFCALRAWMEVIPDVPTEFGSVTPASTRQLEAYLGGASDASLIISPLNVRKAHDDAQRRTAGHAAVLALGFTKKTTDGLVLKAVDKFKRLANAAANQSASLDVTPVLKLCGGEVLAARSLVGSNATDPYYSQLLADRVAAHPQLATLLWEFVKASGGADAPKTVETSAFRLDVTALNVRQLSVCSSNAASLLHRAKQSFAGKDLRRCTLAASALGGVCLSGADCGRADLRFASLKDAMLDHCRFTDTDMKGVDLGASRQLSANHHSGAQRTGAILSIVFVPLLNHELVISGCETGYIHLWDCESADILAKGHHGTAPVTSVALNQAGTLCASASGSSFNTTIVVWQLVLNVQPGSTSISTKFVPVARLVGHADRVSSVAFVSSTVLLSSSSDWSLKLWDVATAIGERGATLHRGDGTTSSGSTTPPPARSPSHATTTSVPSPGAGGRSRQTVAGRLAPIPGSRPLKPLAAGTPTSHSAPTPGSPLRTSQVLASDRPQRDANALTSKRTRALDLSAGDAPTDGAAGRESIPAVMAHGTFVRHRSLVTAMAVSATANLCASLSVEGIVVVVATDAVGTLVTNFHAAAGTKGADTIAFNPEGTRLALPNPRGLNIVNPKTGEGERALHFPAQSTDVTSAICFSPDGSSVAAAQEADVVLWDIASGLLLRVVRLHSARVASITFNNAGSQLLTSSWDGSIRMADLTAQRLSLDSELTSSDRAAVQPRDTNGSPSAHGARRLPLTTTIAQLSKPESIEFTFGGLCEGGNVLVVCSTKCFARSFNAATGTMLGCCCNLNTEVTAFAASLTSDLFAAAGTDLVVGSARCRMEPLVIPLHTRTVSGIAFVTHAPHDYTDPLARAKSPTLIMGVAQDRAVRVWDVFSGVLLLAYSSESPMWALTSSLRLPAPAANATTSTATVVPRGNARSIRSDASASAAAVSTFQLVLLDGFLSTKNLMLHVLKPLVYPSSTLPLPSTAQHVANVAGFGTDLPLKKQRLLVAIANSLRGAGGARAVVQSVLPFTRKTMLPNSVNDVGPIRVPGKEGTLRLAVGGKDDGYAAVTADRGIIVWDLVKRSQLYAVPDRHGKLITSVAFVTQPNQTFIVTASIDGMALMTTLLSGDPVAVFKPAVASPMWLALPSLDGEALFTAGGGSLRMSRAVRRWTLRGVPCRIGNVQPFRSMNYQALSAWLTKAGLQQLGPLLQKNAIEASDLLTSSPRIFETLLAAGAAPQDLAALQIRLEAVRNEKTQHRVLEAFDDETISKAAFVGFETRKVVDWLISVGLRATSVLAEAQKMHGQRLLSMTEDELDAAFAVDFEFAAKLVCDEMAVVKARNRETFSQRNYDDVVSWSKPKHPQMQYAFQCLQMTGAQLIDHTDFPYRTVIQCPHCKNEFMDPGAMCNATGKDHADIEPTWDTQTRIRVTALIRVMKDNHAGFVAQLKRLLTALPDAAFSCGTYWYFIGQQQLHISVVRFHVPELAGSASSSKVVVSGAKLRLFSTTRDPPRMVVLQPNTSPADAIRALAGLAVEARRATGAEAHLPTGWTKTTSETAAPVYVHESGYKQPTHPTMPKAVNAGPTGSSMSIRIIRDVSKGALVAPTALNTASARPSPEHEFKAVAVDPLAVAANLALEGVKKVPTPQPLQSVGSDTLAYDAVVVDQVRNAIKQRQLTDGCITFLMCASSLPNVTPVSFACRRPQLSVDFYREDDLCGCAASLDVGHHHPAHGNGSGSHQGASLGATLASHLGEQFHRTGPGSSQGTSHGHHHNGSHAPPMARSLLMCDRFTNVETRCQGHACCVDNPATCKAAPHLVWAYDAQEPFPLVKLAPADTSVAAGSTGQRLHLDGGGGDSRGERRSEDEFVRLGVRGFRVDDPVNLSKVNRTLLQGVERFHDALYQTYTTQQQAYEAQRRTTGAPLAGSRRESNASTTEPSSMAGTTTLQQMLPSSA